MDDIATFRTINHDPVETIGRLAQWCTDSYGPIMRWKSDLFSMGIWDGKFMFFWLLNLYLYMSFCSCKLVVEIAQIGFLQ
jgi:hypothetical protein